ncbi:MAG: DUF6056 family protein [Oscillospiraceae bacterium]|nr:DUF6056 family protein [Oscillospiraceae bacterium]
MPLTDSKKNTAAIRLIFAGFFVLLCVQLSFVFLYADDFGYLSLSEISASPDVRGADFTLPQLMSFLRLHYLSWGGRVLWFFIMICMLRLGLWPARIFEAAGITLLFWLLWRLCARDARLRTPRAAAFLCAAYGLLQLRLITDGVFWFSASYFYVLPLTPVLYAVLTCQRACSGDPLRRGEKFLCLLCAFAGGWSQEHVAAAFLAMLGLLCIWSLAKRRRIPAPVLLCLALAAAGASILLLAPGNGARLALLAPYYPASLPDRVLFGVRNMVRAVFSSRLALPLYAFFGLAALLCARGLRRGRRPLPCAVSLALFSSFAIIYTAELFDTRDIFFTSFATAKYAVCCCAAAAAAYWILQYLFEQKRGDIALLLGGAGGALAVCCATATVTERTLVPFALLLLPCVAFGCLSLATRDERPRGAALAALLLCAAAVVNVGFITAGYARNYGTVRQNDAALRAAAARADAGERVETVALRKLPDYRFSGTQPYFDGQAWLLPWICEYYDLPADTAIVYND